MKRLIVFVLLAGILCGCAPGGVEQQTQATSQEPSVLPEPDPVPQTLPETLPTEDATSQTEPAAQPTTEGEADTGNVIQYENMKAMWLSQFDLTAIYLDGGSQREQGDFTDRMAQVLDNVCGQGFNTVFLQVRPNADSMYPSAYYPMSAYVTGLLGREAEYDPVAVIVSLAHERGLSIHAWINPMRGMAEEEITLVGQEYALRQWYEDPLCRGRYLVNVNGRWYLNPAYSAVADLIVAGASELLERYDFDGLHMDDYFYPTTDPFFDAEAYAAYQETGGTASLADFRRDRLNELVFRLHSLTVESKAGRIFGISPAGNVDTVYNSQYADIYTWCSEEGYIDYVCPQVYWGLEHGSHDFVKVSRQFQDMIQVDSVDLIIGMTFGKALTGEDPWAGTGKDEWTQNQDVLSRCLQTTLALEECRGVAVFCYQYFFDPLTAQPVPETARERETFVPLLNEILWR